MAINTSQVKHQKVYRIGVSGTTDIGSGVKDLNIYAQANDSIGSWDFDKAELIGVIKNVDTQPSYISSDTNSLVLRDENGNPITSSNNPPKHSSNHIYPFEFDNYINGKYYGFWVLAVDNAGNVEQLNESGANSKDQPAFNFTSPLVDTHAPQFDDIESVNDLTWDGTSKHYFASSTDESSKYAGKILRVKNGSTVYTRYVSNSYFDDNKVYIEFQDTSDIQANLTEVKLLPTIAVNGGVGYLELEIPKSNDLNFSKYKIERYCANASDMPAAGINYAGDDNITWDLVGYISAEKYTDRNLKLNKANLSSENAKKFLYKVTPVSIWDNGGNEIFGLPAYTVPSTVNVTNYRPSAGNIPNIPGSITFETNDPADGKIVVRWEKSTDSNGDLRGYELQRQKQDSNPTNSTEYNDDLWETILIADNDLIKDRDNNTKEYIDEDVEPYSPSMTKYTYRVRAFDWAGNTSGWKDGQDGTNYTWIASTDTSIPVIGDSGIAVTGKIGGWSGQISLGNGNDDIAYVDVWGKKAHVQNDVDDASEVYIGRFPVSVGQATINFSWMSAPSNVKYYAKFKWKLVDKYNNEATSGYSPTSAVPSETPQAVIDAFAPSTTGFTIAPNAVPKYELKIVDDTNNSESTFKARITDGSNYQSIDANELKGKRFVNKTTGETRLISQNTESDNSNNELFVITLTTGLSNTPLDSDDVSVEPTHVKVDITRPDNYSNDGSNVGNGSDDTWGTVVLSNFTNPENDLYKGWKITVDSHVTQIASSTASSNTLTLTLKDKLPTDPAGKSVSIELPDDLAGFNIFRQKDGGSWVLAHDTKQNSFGASTSFSIKDYGVSTGTYKYAISAYDLNGNESSITESTETVTITDTVAPGIPNVQGIIGGAGQLYIYWNRTAEDIAYYKISIKDKSGDSIVSEQQIASEEYTLYNVKDSKSDIKLYEYKVDAYDEYGNNLSSTFSTVDEDVIYLNDYMPASGTAPNAISSFTVSTDNDGNASIAIPANAIDPEIRLIRIERKERHANEANFGTYTIISTLSTPELDDNNNFIHDVTYTDLINDRVKVQYKITPIGIGGLTGNSTESQEVDVVDFTGPDISDLDVELSADIGKVWLKFKDVIDINSAKYEIWRTSDVITSWDSVAFYTGSVQPYQVHEHWEKIASIPSTQQNNQQADWIEYTDNDWQPNGTIDDEDTVLTIPYDAKAVYAIVGVDRWGNRGNTYFISYNDISGGNFTENCIIEVPHEPRVATIDKDALYWNFNKSIQANRGDVPVSDPNAVLYPGSGIEVTGTIKYNLDKLSNDYSVVIRKLEKQLELTNINIADIKSIYLYDTSEDNIADNWRFDSTKSWYNESFDSERGDQKEFPEVSAIITDGDDIYIFNYQTGNLWMKLSKAGDQNAGRLFPSVGEFTSVFMLNGVLYISNSTGKNGYGLGVTKIDFTNDKAYRHRTSAGSWYGTWGGNISGRNNSYDWDKISIGRLATTNSIYSFAKVINNTTYIFSLDEDDQASVHKFGFTIINTDTNKSNRYIYDYNTDNLDIPKWTKATILNGCLYLIRNNSYDVYKLKDKIQDITIDNLDIYDYDLEPVLTYNYLDSSKNLYFHGNSNQYLKLENSERKKTFLENGTIMIKGFFDVYYNSGYDSYVIINLGGSGYSYGFRVVVGRHFVRLELGKGSETLGSATYYTPTQKHMTITAKWHTNSGGGTSVELFVDDNFVKKVDFNDKIEFNLTYNYHIGKLDNYGVPGQLKGYINNIRLFNYALSDDKIKYYVKSPKILFQDKWGEVDISSTGNSGQTYAEVTRQGCLAEWKVENYDYNSGELHTTAYIDGDINTDVMLFKNTDTNTKPTLVDVTPQHKVDDWSYKMPEEYKEPYKPMLELPLKSSLYVKHGVGDVVYQRASKATYITPGGVLKYVDNDIPRFEKNGLLIEGSSENLLLWSEKFDESEWGKINTSVSLSTSVKAPDNNNYAWELKDSDDSEDRWHDIRQTKDTAFNTITNSFMVKVANNDKGIIGVYYYNSSGDQIGHIQYNFDLTNKSITYRNNNNTTNYSATIKELSNGWFRISVTGAYNGTDTVAKAQIKLVSGQSAYTGDGTTQFYIWGAQMEEMALATSYIKTTDSSATRAKDITYIQYDGNTPLPDKEFTITTDVDMIGSVNDTAWQHIMDFSDTYRYMTFVGKNYHGTGSKPSTLVVNSADDQKRIYDYHCVDFNTKYRVSYIQQSNLLTKLFVNNEYIEQNGDNKYANAVVDKICIGMYKNSGGQLFGHISNIRIFDKAFDDNEAKLL